MGVKRVWTVRKDGLYLMKHIDSGIREIIGEQQASVLTGIFTGDRRDAMAMEKAEAYRFAEQINGEVLSMAVWEDDAKEE